MGIEILFLLLPVAALSGWWVGRRSGTKGRDCADGGISPDYFKGLNHLLNEQPDEAIEVFVKMLDAQSDTVEVHFALGNLFRRRGEVDRAIRVHQNLIARPTLTREQRNQSLYELGRDYMRAGLLDRAENLFLELADDSVYGESALRQLLEVYQQEKEWARAVGVADRLSGRTGSDMRPLVAQFYCELAEEAIAQGDVGRAQKMLKRALAEDRRCARASLLDGDLQFRAGNAKAAIKSLRRVEEQDADYLPEALEPLRACYAALGRPGEMVDYLRGVLDRHGGISAMLLLAELLRRREGDTAAMVAMADFLRHRPSVRGMARLIQVKLAANQQPAHDDLELLGELTGRILDGKPIYKCCHCGFTGKTLHWQCPSCKEWTTVKPIQGVEGE